MPPVINVSNIHHLEELPRTQVSVMLHRWVKRGLVRRLAPRARLFQPHRRQVLAGPPG